MESQPDCQTFKCPTKYQTQSKRNVTRSNHTIWGEAESITFQMYVTITANIWLHAIELILTQQNCNVHQKRSTNRRACSVQPTMCRPIRVKCHHNTGYRGVCDLCDCPADDSLWQKLQSQHWTFAVRASVI